MRHCYVQLCDVCAGDLREGNNLEDLGVDGIIILKQVFNKWDREVRSGLIRLRIGTGDGRL